MYVTSDSDQPDQQMLELVYGLVSEDEAARLREQIANEPAAGEAYERAQRTANVFCSAAKWREPPMEALALRAAIRMGNGEWRVRNGSVRSKEYGVRSTEDGVPGPLSQAALGEDSMAPLRQALRWAIGLAATVLFAFLLGGYLHHRGRLSAVAQRHLRMTVTGPSQLAPGARNEFRIKTTDMLGEAQSVALQCTLLDSAGRKLFAEQVNTDANGRFELRVPKDAALPPAARLEVLAFHGDESYRLETALPVSPYRFLTRVSTDKPLYRPGEVVRYRSLTLGRFGLDTPGDLPVHFEIQDPTGAVVAGSERQGITQRGVGNGEFPLPTDRPGGEYRLIARSLNGAFPEEKRTLYVREYRTPQLKKELEFIRDSYTPGDRVAADLSVNKAQGGPAAAAQLTVSATVDGQMVYQASDKAGPNGAFRVEFDLPKEIERGDGQLAIQCDDGGVRETIAKTIPINLGKVELYFCPEGGDLVAGLENRVYFKATNPLGKPVHVEGALVDASGTQIAQIETTHKGMGSFAFTPSAEATYDVRLNRPADVTTVSKLPEPNADRAIVLSTGAGVFDADEPIKASLRSAKRDVPTVIAAYCRGVQVAHEMVTLEEGANTVSLAVSPEASGVIRLTVYDYSHDEQGAVPRAIAERLVYRKPDRRLQIRVADHAEKYAPGDTVELSLLALNEAGKPAKSAVFGCAVVDDSLLKLADDDSPAMPTHFYLTSEVEKPEDLEKADFYLTDNPQADEALDLLLGTQGWRRFVEQSLEELQQKAKEAGQPVKPAPPVERLLALGGAALPPTVLDNLDEVRVQYERAREEAEWDHRASVAQLSRAASYGGIVLGTLLIAVNVAPYLRRSRDWSWLAASQRFGPALAAAGLCIVVSLLWNPASWDLPESNLVALEEFKLRPIAMSNPTGEVSLGLALNGNLAGRSLNRVENYWYFGRGEPWGDVTWGKRLGEQHQLAYFDMYRFDDRDKALKLRTGALGDVQIEFLEGLDQIVIRGHPRDVERVTEIIRQIEAAAVPGQQPEALAKLSTLDRRWHFANGNQYGYSLSGDAKSGDYDALYDEAAVELFERRIKQLRFPVREYAHQHVASENGVRTDFAETVYWHPLLISDENGQATVKFELSDSVTSYRVQTEAHDGAGRIGTGDGEILSRLPFAVEPKLPLEVNAGDRIELPVAVSNDSSQPLETALSCTVGGSADRTLRVRDGARSVPTPLGLLKLEDSSEQRLAVAPGSRARTYFTLDVVGQKGTAEVEVRGEAGSHADAKRQSIRVVPPGFPMAESYAGRIDGEQEVTIDLPESVIPGTLEVTLAAYPSTLATLQSGLEGILREPSGCFEQASSSNYPNLLLLQYLEEHKVSQPELMRRGKEFLQAGYSKLTGYECKNRGFEWFGADPGHEALTAYGLMEFRDMAKVYDVDPALLDRTAEWLLGRRDGNGGFRRNEKKLDGFGSAPDQITNAYIVWALCESGQEGIEKELENVIEHARGSNDAYEVALAAASAVDGKRLDEGRDLLGKLVTLQDREGRLIGKEGSITRSGGEALAIETTALAALAWLKLPEFREQANRAIDWIVRNRSGDGSFGSTQATILALKALVEHAKVNRATVAAGEVIVKHGDRVIGTQTFGANAVNTIRLAGLEGELTPGKNELTISLTGENQMPYTIDVSYRAKQPESHPECAVELSTKLAATEVKAGETVALEAELVNKTNHGQPMTVAILGLPAGLQPRADQLEELKKAGTVDYFETRAREVICYWRSLAPNKRVPLRLDLVAEWPGRYTGPASRAYLYYTAEQKHWVAPLAVKIAR
ncbi:MAG: MG2 domain-containing protein [Pirellulales bacterium]